MKQMLGPDRGARINSPRTMIASDNVRNSYYLSGVPRIQSESLSAAIVAERKTNVIDLSGVIAYYRNEANKYCKEGDEIQFTQQR